MKPLFAALSVTVFSAVVSGAQAQALADASMSNLRLVLTDLDPNDGITPSITYNPVTGIRPDTAAAARDSAAG